MTVVASEVFVDWLTLNAHPLKSMNYLRHFLADDSAHPCKAAYHHQFGYLYYPSHVRQYLTRDSMDTTSTWVVDGEAWNIVRSEWSNQDALKILRILARGAINFTRIDLTMDIFDKGELAEEFCQLANTGNLESGKRQVRTMMLAGGWGGCTTYIGSRSSAKMLRIYDKNAESHGAIPATRIEFELKGYAAQGVQRALLEPFDLLMARRLYSGLLWDFLPGEHLQGLFGIFSEGTYFIEPPVHERQMSWKDWVRKQVLPGTDGTPGSEEWDKLIWLARELNTRIHERSE